MLFMVIERFRDNDMVPIYQRLRETLSGVGPYHCPASGSEAPPADLDWR